MWSTILLMSRLPGGHSMSAGRWPELARLPTVDSLLVGTTRRLVPKGGSYWVWSATRVKGPRPMSIRRSWRLFIQQICRRPR